jgi:hypothetical protein
MRSGFSQGYLYQCSLFPPLAHSSRLLPVDIQRWQMSTKTMKQGQSLIERLTHNFASFDS